MLNIYNIEKSNYVNGKGCRYVLWLQGCNLACPSCWNKQTWSFDEQTLLSFEEVFSQIVNLENNIDGVTFSGGEPFLQAKDLSLLAEKIKNETNLSLQIFTGFEKNELITENQKNLLRYTDILISGRFDENIKNNNQKSYILNDQTDIWEFNNSDVEIEIDDDLNVKITGYPTNELIKEIKAI